MGMPGTFQKRSSGTRPMPVTDTNAHSARSAARNPGGKAQDGAVVGKKGLQAGVLLGCEHQQAPQQQLEGQGSRGDWNGAQADEEVFVLEEQVGGRSQDQPAQQSERSQTENCCASEEGPAGQFLDPGDGQVGSAQHRHSRAQTGQGGKRGKDQEDQALGRKAQEGNVLGIALNGGQDEGRHGKLGCAQQQGGKEEIASG